MNHNEDLKFIIGLLCAALSLNCILFVLIKLFTPVFALGFAVIFALMFIYCKIMEDLRS